VKLVMAFMPGRLSERDRRRTWFGSGPLSGAARATHWRTRRRLLRPQLTSPRLFTLAPKAAKRALEFFAARVNNDRTTSRGA
jgi:hypothetical protein